MCALSRSVTTRKSTEINRQKNNKMDNVRTAFLILSYASDFGLNILNWGRLGNGNQSNSNKNFTECVRRAETLVHQLGIISETKCDGYGRGAAFLSLNMMAMDLPRRRPFNRDADRTVFIEGGNIDRFTPAGGLAKSWRR